MHERKTNIDDNKKRLPKNKTKKKTSKKREKKKREDKEKYEEKKNNESQRKEEGNTKRIMPSSKTLGDPAPAIPGIRL